MRYCTGRCWQFSTAAAGGIAVINAVGNLGGFVAPNVKTWAETIFGTGAAGIYTLALASLAAAILVAVLPRRPLAQRAAPKPHAH